MWFLRQIGIALWRSADFGVNSILLNFFSEAKIENQSVCTSRYVHVCVCIHTYGRRSEDLLESVLRKFTTPLQRRPSRQMKGEKGSSFRTRSEQFVKFDHPLSNAKGNFVPIEGSWTTYLPGMEVRRNGVAGEYRQRRLARDISIAFGSVVV